MDPRGVQYAVAAVLGHLHALAGNSYSATLFLTAARSIERPGTPIYRPLEALLARQYLRSGNDSLAVRSTLELVRKARRGPR